MPAVVFDNLTADQVVELFVTINSKHTKLNPSHLISLAGRRLYRDDNLAAAHDVIRTLNEDEGSPLKGSIKVLGHRKGHGHPGLAGRRAARRLRGDRHGRRARSPASSARTPGASSSTTSRRPRGPSRPRSPGRKYSIKSSTSLRAFIRIVPYVIAMVRKRGGDVWSAGELDAALRPWAESIGDRRFETETVWKEKLTGGTRSGVEILARELRQGLNA